MKQKWIKGLRHMPSLTPAFLEARHSLLALEEEIDLVRKEGISFTPSALRRSIIGGLEIRAKGESGRSAYARQVPNLVVIGCACFGTALPLRSFCLLLQKLGIDYAFLQKEYCCGAPLLHRALHEGRDREPIDQLAKGFIGLNIAQARERGISTMIYFCPWCAYLAQRFYPKGEIEQLFYVDILARHIDGTALKLEGQVGYFGGRPHRRAVYVPDESFDLNWGECRTLLNRVRGLEVVDIPRYCCQIAPEAIFKKAQADHFSTIVVSCVVCYGRLSRISPPGIEIRFVTDLLLDALNTAKRRV